MLQCWVSEREFYIGGSTLLCHFVEPATFVRCVYSILCPLGPGALSGNQKLKCRTVVIQKEPVSWSLVSYSILCPWLWLQFCRSELGKK